MKIFPLAVLLFVLPVSVQAVEKTKPETQSVTPGTPSVESDSNPQIDSVKKGDSRNMMLNAESATVPREVNVGLPASGTGAVVYIDDCQHAQGLPRGHFHWAGGNSYEPVGSISLMEAVIRTGQIGVVVDSHTKYGTDEHHGTVTAGTSTNGLIHFDAYAGGPINKKKGWYYAVGAYLHFDPTAVNAPTCTFVDKKQIYQASISKRWKKSELNLTYRYSWCADNVNATYNTYNVAPFIYNGDGTVSTYNGFRIGIDSYFPGNEDVRYMDVVTGEIKTDKMSNMDRRYTHDIILKGHHFTNNGWKLSSTFHACLMQPSSYLTADLSGIDDASGLAYTTASGQAYTGKVQKRLANMVGIKTNDLEWLNTAESTFGRHTLKLGASLVFADQFLTGSTFYYAHTVEANPVRIYKDGESCWGFNTNALYLDARRWFLALFAFDDWKVNDRLFLRFGLRVKPSFQNINNALDDGTYNVRKSGSFYVQDPLKSRVTNIKHWGLDYAASLHADYRIAGRLFAMAEGFYSMTEKTSTYYKASSIPSLKPIGNALGRVGLNYDNSWAEASLLFSFIKCWDCAAVISVTHESSVDSETIPWVAQYGVNTPGITLDGTMHFGGGRTRSEGSQIRSEGFKLHTVLTYQNPRYTNYDNRFVFKDGTVIEVNYSGKIPTGISRFIAELNPSFDWPRLRVWASIRYFSREYVSRTNYAYFNGHVETFAGATYKFNGNHSLSLDLVNLLFQNGIKGSIEKADTVKDPSELSGKICAGGYMRPFQAELKYTFRF